MKNLIAAVSFFLLLGFGSAANAQFVTYVSGTGDDANSCYVRAQPCLSLNRAITQVSANGVVVVVDAGAVSLSSINKSVSIEGKGNAFITGGTGIGILIGSGDVVRLKGLTFNGGRNASTGISFQGAGALHIDDCDIRDYVSTTLGGFTFVGTGIEFLPSGQGQLVVTNSRFSRNGSNNTGAGIRIRPTGSGSARVTLSNVVAATNVFGVAVDGEGSTGGINVTIADSILTGNSQDGLVATSSSGGAPIGITVKNSRFANNSIGVRSLAPGTTVRLESSVVSGNGTGLVAGNGGALLTAGNNLIQANGATGAFTGSIALQ